MKFLKGLLIFAVVIVLILAVVMVFLPSEASVERTRTIDAPVEDVYQQVVDFRNWESWSPWVKKDPNIELTYSENSVGQGAWYTWKSDNDEVGSGKLSMTAASKNNSIATKLEFDGMDPSQGRWTFEKVADGTKVTWGMDAELTYSSKLFGLMMDGFIGPDFEKGLELLEKAAKDNPAFISIEGGVLAMD